MLKLISNLTEEQAEHNHQKRRTTLHRVTKHLKKRHYAEGGTTGMFEWWEMFDRDVKALKVSPRKGWSKRNLELLALIQRLRYYEEEPKISLVHSRPPTSLDRLRANMRAAKAKEADIRARHHNTDGSRFKS